MENANPSRAANAKAMATDFSLYSLRQLFAERYWIDAERDSARGRSLEREIHRRCAYIRERIHSKPSAAGEPAIRFRPSGLISGVIFLAVSSGPFVAVKLLDFIHFIRDPNGDQLTLAGVWALVTLPLALPVLLIGAIMDAGRVVKWFGLTARQR